MIFKQCIETGVFPSEWKKSKIFPIYKKGDKKSSCRLYLLVKKFLKDYCLTKYLNSLSKINLFHQIIPVLNRMILALINCYLSLMIYMNVLIMNVWIFTKPFAGFFKGKNTMPSRQRKIFYMGKYQCWSTSRFYPWSLVVFYLN